MVSHLITTTLQAAFLSAVSNLAAQGIKAYRESLPFSVKLAPLAQFVVFTFISCPPNILWQEYLEYKFPGYTIAPISPSTTSSSPNAAGTQLHIPNTLRKFLFDQTLGAFVNTVAFVAAMAAFKGKSAKAVRREVERDVIPLMISSWKLWPIVALLNFTLVPVNRRVIVASVVGLFWGIYLSLFAALD
ncbi:uncharacterized protein PV07_06900 [Cladophialophora immunda]|uniref:Uncharacterized protein n=1 Tax=Cladophialophora immunda TaxID=569365 RepID=A0A0D1ZGT2_9EURO|nr:uncharacterized protein PV07_06900 [Cladophialophora immunda]KIW27131.1 hypothetical protein PV07_06900 [Cladophialophora immunda]OQU99630.1 hypothetical protein CLAIMM_05238 [Cladophialophora immunda]